ncbi:MAG: peptidoglycan editing factor PgeF [Syntrophobacterales bacterium]|nr:peptidoglycan editing factor PgeF [Syntrophobacterales bacterium]
MFRLANRGRIGYLEAQGIQGLAFATHAFCTRRTGVSRGGFESLNVGELVGDTEENVKENLELVKREFAIPPNGLVMCRQVHGDRIIEIGKDEPLPLPMPEGDGLVTARPGIALGIKTADCVPLLFFDRRLRVAGAAHAGWRGTALGIAAKMIDIFLRRFASQREDIIVLVGPAIASCCYEVDAPVYEAFAGRTKTERFFRKRRGKERWMFDISLANRVQLREAGIPANNIMTSAMCTACRRELFFSHRAARGKDEGRQLTLIMIN